MPALPPSDLPATAALDRDRHRVIPPAAQLAVAEHAPAHIVKVDAFHAAAMTRLTFLVADGDQAIPPEAQRQFAGRMGAITVEVPTNHVAMVSHPDDVLNLITTAAHAVPALTSMRHPGSIAAGDVTEH